jgi:hypothetical protein
MIDCASDTDNEEQCRRKRYYIWVRNKQNFNNSTYTQEVTTRTSALKKLISKMKYQSG